jgi:hypothetical protein
MGDRSNIFIQQGQKADGTWTGIGVYSHWHGTQLHDAAIEALPKAQGRIGDDSYFARIVIHNVLVAVADPDSETGTGLWVDGIPDNEHPILVINAHTGDHWYASEETFRYDKS